MPVLVLTDIQRAKGVAEIFYTVHCGGEMYVFCLAEKCPYYEKNVRFPSLRFSTYFKKAVNKSITYIHTVHANVFR